MKDEAGKIATWACACMLTLAFTGSAWADVIWVGSGAGRGFRQEVDILDIEADQLVYLVNGNRGTTPLLRIQQIELAGDAGFNEGEAAFAAGEWNKAAAAYLTSARRHAKQWARRRAAERLVLAAQRAARFDLAVTGYIQLTLVAPEAAVGKEPELSEEIDAEQLARSAVELQQALDAGVAPAQARPMLALLLAVHNRRGDDQAAATVVERLGRVMGPETAQLDPALYAQVLIGRANLALARGQLDQAVGLVEQGRKYFAEPRQQSDALMILARAADRRAGEDRGRLMDAALAYMKVVAFFKRDQDAPNVPEALLRTGQIHEQLGLHDVAADLYRDLVSSYPKSPAASEAQKRLDSLSN